MQLIKIGEIYEHSKIIRVDKDWGLLLEIPSPQAPTPAYVTVCISFTLVFWMLSVFSVEAKSESFLQISDVADEDGIKLEKKFREGNDVRVRILGFRYLDGLAMGVMKVCFQMVFLFTLVWQLVVHCLVTSPSMVIPPFYVTISLLLRVLELYSSIYF